MPVKDIDSRHELLCKEDKLNTEERRQWIECIFLTQRDDAFKDVLDAATEEERWAANIRASDAVDDDATLRDQLAYADTHRSWQRACIEVMVVYRNAAE